MNAETPAQRAERIERETRDGAIEEIMALLDSSPWDTTQEKAHKKG